MNSRIRSGLVTVLAGALAVIAVTIACRDAADVDDADAAVVFEVTPEPIADVAAVPKDPSGSDTQEDPSPELTLETWTERLLSRKSFRLAVREVETFGAAAIPALRRALQDPRPEIRSAALCALSILGPVAADIAEAVETELSDERDSIRAQAFVTLGKLGKSGRVLELAPKLLGDPSAFVRAHALFVVSRADPSPDMVSRIERVLESEPSAEVRQALVHLAGRTDPGGETVCRSLGDPDGGVRRSAIPYCTGPGTASWKALLSLVGDPEKDISVSARSAVKKLGPPADREAHLADLLRASDPARRATAARILGRLGESTALIERTLRDDDASVRQAVLDGLESSWTTGGVAAETIRSALDDPSEGVRAAAAAVLTVYRAPLTARTLDRMLELLDSPRPEIESRILTALTRVGRPGEAITAALVRRLGDPDVEVRSRAARALGAGEGGERSLAPSLVRALRNETDLTVRLWLVVALGKCGSAEVEVLRVLTSALARDEDWSTRHAAAEALGRLGPSAAATAATLKAAAERDSRAPVRLQAGFALWQVTGDRSVAERIIIETLNTVARSGGARLRWSGLLAQAVGFANRCDLRTVEYLEALENAAGSDAGRVCWPVKEARKRLR